MKNKKKTGIGLLFVMALLAVLFVLRGVEAPSPLRIGALHALSGSAADREKPLMEALQLAVEEANASGGVQGRPVELVQEDCRADARFCATRAEKLISEDGVAALFGCGDAECRRTVTAVAEKHHLLFFHAVQHEGGTRSIETLYAGMLPNQQMVPLLNWALQQQGRRAYVLAGGDAYGHEVGALADRVLQAQSAQRVGGRYLDNRDEKAMANVVRDIVRRRPDFVLNLLDGADSERLLLAVYKAGLKAERMPVFSLSVTEWEQSRLGTQGVVGHYVASNYFQSMAGEANRAFIERFRQRFGPARTVTAPMVNTYIAFSMWLAAVRASSGQGPDEVLRRLRNMSMSTVLGVLNEEHGYLWQPVRIGRARSDGQFDIVWSSARNLAPAPRLFIALTSESAILRPEAAP